MEKFYHFKNRLSLSMDKLTSSHDFKVFSTETDSGVVTPSNLQEPHSSISGASVDSVERGSCSSSSIEGFLNEDTGTTQEDTRSEDEINLSSRNSFDHNRINEPPSLIEEVMNEVKKLSDVKESFGDMDKIRYDNYTPESDIKLEDKDNITLVSNMDSAETTNSPAPSSSTDSAESKTVSISSKSTTPGSSKERARSQTTSPIPRIFRRTRSEKDNSNKIASPINKSPDNEKPKKESIYSRLIRSTKRDNSSSRLSKEPIYASVKPKTKTEPYFKPIEPVSSQNQNNSEIVKPEPIYNKAKINGEGLTETAPGSSPSSMDGRINPISKINSKVTRDKKKSRSLPFEPLYNRIKKKDPAKMVLSVSPTNNIESPIYHQPLPDIPNQTTLDSKIDVLPNEAEPYGKVKVRAKEIVACKASIVTINNPGYAKPPVHSPTNPITHPSNSCSSNKEVKKTINDSGIEVDSKNIESPVIDSTQVPLLNTEEDLGVREKSRLSHLVEELAQELESVTRRTGLANADDDQAKKKVLTKLLSTYDVPKNPRRVEEVNDEVMKASEAFSYPATVKSEELRFVDDDEETMVYGDVPDYSQDEFFIALDDETDPKYDSLTQDMRHKYGGDSPGKVSRKSAQVYVNVVNVISALKVLINSNSTKAATVINKMGTIARPYAQKVQTSIGDTQWIQRRIFHRSGHNGFDELRKYIKSGGEFCKELAVIMHERSELESSYAKGLHKLSSKLMKASRDAPGTINEAWQAIGVELEHEGDLHRILSASLSEEIVRPLRVLIETQHKIRKGVESLIDKTTKNLHDWRVAETKSKKNSYHNNKENEKVQEMIVEARLGRRKLVPDKDLLKLEKQCRKAEDAVQKSDIEYYTFSVKSERARQEWESAIYRGSNCFQTLEEERLAALKDLIFKYYEKKKEAAPKFLAISARLDDPVQACDIDKDIQTIVAAKGTGENNPEQNLPDFYAEDINNIMNKGRRRDALDKFNKLIRSDLDREKRGKQGVENLAKALQETPNFGGEDSQQDVNDKLQHMKAMLAYLEAARYKIQCSLNELNNLPPPAHPLAKHMEGTRDKQGVLLTVLKVPPWVKANSAVDICAISDYSENSPNWNDRGTADGNSTQPDSDFGNSEALTEPSHLPDVPNSSSVRRSFMYPTRYPSLILSTDEFSSQGSEQEFHNQMNEDSKYIVGTGVRTSGEDYLDSGTGSAPDGTYYARPLTAVQASGRCKALYDYEANMYDELTIKTGDIINVHEKQPDGWWVGELDGIVGIFPATYVEEIDFTI